MPHNITNPAEVDVDVIDEIIYGYGFPSGTSADQICHTLAKDGVYDPEDPQQAEAVDDMVADYISDVEDPFCVGCGKEIGENEECESVEGGLICLDCDELQENPHGEVHEKNPSKRCEKVGRAAERACDTSERTGRAVMAGARRARDEFRRNPYPDVNRAGVISYNNAHPGGTPVASSTRRWDADAVRRSANARQMYHASTWVEPGKEEDKSAYKFPHHYADEDNTLSPRGVAAAMGALMGARSERWGGPHFPDVNYESARRGIYKHLAEHYRRDLGREPPPLEPVGGRERLPERKRKRLNPDHIEDIQDTDIECSKCWEIYNDNIDDPLAAIPAIEAAAYDGRIDEEQAELMVYWIKLGYDPYLQNERLNPDHDEFCSECGGVLATTKEHGHPVYPYYIDKSWCPDEACELYMVTELRSNPPSTWTVKFHKRYGDQDGDLGKIAAVTGFKRSTLDKVRQRGYAAWHQSHRKGVSQAAWGLARVYSFVMGGPTSKGPDKDLYDADKG